VALRNPHVEEVSYQHPSGYERGAVRLVVYLFRRPDDKKGATRESTWATVPEGRRLGDAGAFIRAANERTRTIREDAARRGKDLSRNKARWCTSFVNVVLSPANRERLSDEDFARLARPWVRGRDGEELPHVGAVHREGAGKVHLHLGIVRDKFSAEELRVLKDMTDGLAVGLERERTMHIDREELSYGLEL
jgi:hypothetical protein